ncbi:MAG: PAS domain S-box protein [Verrucomicrobia bacterium]|jgi:PAS domain S-box-containing protein|nr:PAS domain S-box protein [Verrucomicrobiota bacterium]
MATNREMLRQEAEAILHRNPSETPVLPTADAQALVHELRVYEAELETQNQELRDTERKLAASRDRYEELFEFAPTGFLTLDWEGEIVEANMIAATMFGIERRDLALHHNFAEFVAPEDLNHWRHFREDVLDSRGTRHCDLTLKRDHTGAWGAHVEGCVLHAESGDENLWMIDLVDVTAQQRTDQALRESMARYRSIFESIRDVYMEIELDGTILEVSPSIEAFSGYTREEMLGQPMKALYVHPEERSELLDQLRQVGQVNNYEVVLRSKAGEEIICSLNVRLVTDATGTPWKISGTMRDVTECRRLEVERKKLEANLRQAQKMEAVGQLAGGVAHDFNNLLMCMMGCVDLCRDELPPGHTCWKLLDEISHDARRSADLIRQLLAFARKQTIVPKVLDVNAIVTQMLKMMRRLIGEDVTIAWHPGEGVWPIRADPSQVEQVLANLCVNARDAIEGVGVVHVTTSNTTLDDAFCQCHSGAVPGEFVVLKFRDSGCGMAPATLERVFEPFFTTKGIGNGTGMGLSTVFGIVKQHNGFLDVSSEPGRGTTFRIYLPRQITKEGSMPRASHAPATIPEGHGVVLLVDDQASIRKTTRMLLERMGYTVVAADSPREAQRLSAEYAGKIDLLLTDVIMPDMNGRDLAEALAKDRPEMKCVFMSGYTADITARSGVENGTVEFLSKPFTRNELAHKLKTVLRKG